MRNPLVLTIVIVLLLGTIIYLLSTKNNQFSTNSNYEQKVLSVQEIEKNQPLNFLLASCVYHKNFLGNKFVIEGNVKNSATVESYKDAVITIEFRDISNNLLSTNNYTAWGNYPPNSEVPFNFKLDAYNNVSSISVNVANAIPNN